MEPVLLEDIEKLKALTGTKRSSDVIRILGRQVGLINALATSPGKEILAGALNRLGALLEKIIQETATSQETAEYRALRKIVGEWTDRINTYFEQYHKLKDAGGV